MAFSRRRLAIALAFAGMTAFAACSGESATATPQPSPTATAEPSSTPGPTATQESATPTATVSPTRAAPTSTSTPSSATPTPEPTTVPPTPTPAFEEIEDIQVYSGGVLMGLDDVELGELLPLSESVDSVCASGGEFGSTFSETSIFNPDSVYGGPFGEQSPFNPDSTSPPTIVVNGNVVGSLSVSPLVANAVSPEAVLTELGCPEQLP